MKKEILSRNFVTILLLVFLSSTWIKGDSDNKLTIGGYGELHFNRNSVDGGEYSNKVDFHRFVIFLGYQWNERWSFQSEVELEHNFVKDGQGELELEQAYVNYYGSQYFSFKVGVLLPSLGLINDKHEPTLFLSVERPDYAKHIIPTTWFGNGIAFNGQAGGFDYQLTLMEGIKGENISTSSGIRSARQKGFNATVDNPLVNFRLDYIGTPGLLAGASYSRVSPEVPELGHLSVDIMEFHLKYDNNRVYTVFEIGKIRYGKGDPKASFGYYLDLGYNVGSLLNTSLRIIPWFRITRYNTSHELRDGGLDPDSFMVDKWLVGVAVKPLNNVIFKFELGEEKRGNPEQKTKHVNLGVGYQF